MRNWNRFHLWSKCSGTIFQHLGGRHSGRHGREERILQPENVYRTMATRLEAWTVASFWLSICLEIWIHPLVNRIWMRKAEFITVEVQLKTVLLISSTFCIMACDCFGSCRVGRCSSSLGSTSTFGFPNSLNLRWKLHRSALTFMFTSYNE